ncbi:alpha/beta hydrolase [Rhodococcus sp. DMU1]|uniref:alpha/beta fold hydrolase n=1 Tax=Rhodococcus sp. DMU1 TaxID=2722825 RepID=UPI00143EB380|nr:alpha/beta hydrolase [Rhodococcus sp. DMU1]QIX53601.1 alpha/beta hydrolase [Rhodococcus sp. DMU1]
MGADDSRPSITIAGTTSQFLDPSPDDGALAGRLRYLMGGSGSPVLLLHTVRTQAEHFQHLIPLLLRHHTVYALDLPGMGYSDIVPGASYDEPAMRAGVTRLLMHLDLHEVTVVGESMGAVLALTAAAESAGRVRRVVAINPYDYAGGILRSGVLARGIISGILAPVIGPRFATIEPKPVMHAILRGGFVDDSALTNEYLDELLAVGKRPGYASVARAVYGALPSLVAARSVYPRVTVPVDLVYGEHDWSRASDRDANNRALPHAEFVQIPDAGHFLSLEKPAVIAALLDRSTDERITRTDS